MGIKTTVVVSQLFLLYMLIILKKNPKIVGIYRLIMKAGSDNFRASAIQTIIEKLRGKGKKVIIYEPTIFTDDFEGYKVENNFNEFINQADIIIANRITEELKEISEKVYTRDIFNED